MLWKWFLFLVALAIIDGVQTVLLLSDLGLRSEANPVMRGLMNQFGFAGMWGLKLFTLSVVGLTMHRYSPPVMPILSALMLCVVVSNFYQLNVASPALSPALSPVITTSSEGVGAGIYILDSFDRYPEQ